MNGKPSLNYYAIIDEEGKMPRMTEDVWDWPELAKTIPTVMNLRLPRYIKAHLLLERQN